jgi:TrmH RNA methyltransferase
MTPRRPAEPRRPRRPGPPRAAPARGEERRGHAGPPPDLVRIAGLPAVRALFETDPDAVLRLFFDARTAPLVGDLAERLARARRPYRLVGADELAKVAGTQMHGGVVAVTPARPVPAFDPAAAARDGRPLLVLDGVGNPHNLGAVARTAAFFGLGGLVLSGHPAQALPSEAAHRVSEGGLLRIGAWRADPLVPALRALRPAFRVVGTALEGARDFRGFPPGGPPVAVVLGNEEEGLGKATLAACDEVVRLPGAGRVQSLNVAATAAVLAWEAARARG